MNLTLNLSSNKLDADDLQALTRELCHKINTETADEATLQTVEETDAKGKKISVGIVFLRFATSPDQLVIEALLIILEEFERRGIHFTFRKENGESYTLQEWKEMVKNREWQKLIQFSSNT